MTDDEFAVYKWCQQRIAAGRACPDEIELVAKLRDIEAGLQDIRHELALLDYLQAKDAEQAG